MKRWHVKQGRYHEWRLWVLLGMLWGVAMLAACTGQPGEVTVRSVPVQRIPARAGVYFDVTWLSTERLVVMYEPNLEASTFGTARLWQLRPDGSDMRMLDLPEDREQCERTEFRYPQALWEGRLAFMRVCQPYEAWWESDPRLMAWDPDDGSSQLLRDYELPSHVASFTFAPDVGHGVLATDTGIEDDLYWLDEQAPRPVDVGLVRARRPAWSPDGQSIVFFGNRQLRGRPGPQWATQPYDLWLMPADCETRSEGCAKSLQRLVRDILDQTAVNWSPDGRWIVFDGNPQGQGRGIWLRRMDTGQLTQVLAGDYVVPNWSPDGKRLVVIGPPEGQENIGTFDNGSALYILDVSAVVGGQDG